MIRKWAYYSSIVILVYFLGLKLKPLEERKYDWFYVDENIKVKSIVLLEDEIEFVGFPFIGKSYAGFKQALAKKESQGKYRLINPFGYMGKYQFGVGTLRTIGVHNTIAFINNPIMQEKAFNVLLSVNKSLLQKEIEKFEGTVINGVEITESGILAAAHLGGAGSVKIYFRSKGKRMFKDAYGTSIVSYMKDLSGYDTSHIVADPQARVVMN